MNSFLFPVVLFILTQCPWTVDRIVDNTWIVLEYEYIFPMDNLPNTHFIYIPAIAVNGKVVEGDKVCITFNTVQGS